jgi:hypothetical protein
MKGTGKGGEEGKGTDMCLITPLQGDRMVSQQALGVEELKPASTPPSFHSLGAMVVW